MSQLEPHEDERELSEAGREKAAAAAVSARPDGGDGWGDQHATTATATAAAITTTGTSNGFSESTIEAHDERSLQLPTPPMSPPQGEDRERGEAETNALPRDKFLQEQLQSPPQGDKEAIPFLTPVENGLVVDASTASDAVPQEARSIPPMDPALDQGELEREEQEHQKQQREEQQREVQQREVQQQTQQEQEQLQIHEKQQREEEHRTTQQGQLGINELQMRQELHFKEKQRMQEEFDEIQVEQEVQEQQRVADKNIATEYQLKAIEWADPRDGRAKRLKIITQNENGPCPLLALCNVLILRGDMEIGPYDRPTVTYEYLAQLLGDFVLSRVSQGETELEKRAEKVSPRNPFTADLTHQSIEPGVQDLQYALNTALSIMPSLQTGMDVNVRFDSVRGFEPTEELSVFDVLQVDLVHGWVIDPQDHDTWEIVARRCGSYNRAVECVVSGDVLGRGLVVESVDDGTGVGGYYREGTLNADDNEKVRDALIVSQFLESTATQLTYHGLLTLVESLASGSLSVFFRNNHFSTLYKNPETNTLFVLVTDAGFANEPAVVWESLIDVDQGAAEFVNSHFQKVNAAGGDYAGVEERKRSSEIVGGSDQDYALALSLQQEEELEHEMLQQRQQRYPGRAGGPPGSIRPRASQQALQEQQRRRQPSQQRYHENGSSSAGSSFTTASTSEKERRKKKGCIIQ